MKKICCYCETWKSGGIESFLTNIFSQIDCKNLCIVLCVSHSQPNIYDLSLAELGISKHILSQAPKEFSLAERIKSIPSFYRELLRERYDVVHLNIYHGFSLLYALIAKHLGTPLIIVHSHNNALRKSRGRGWKLLVHRIMRFLFSGCADIRWACSQSAAAFLFSSRYMHTVQLIPNGIDIQRFRFSQTKRDEMRKKLNLQHSLVLGHVGRLCSQKNQSFLIDLLPKVKEKIPSAKLLLIGDGEDRERLKQKVQMLELTNDVIFGGETADVAALLCAMDCFLFPSLFEGLGIVAIEAQAAGLPVLCSENVPTEAKATKLVHFLPLDIDIWVQALLQVCNKARIDVTAELEANGYGIDQVAHRIKSTYLQEAEK